jgi:hypothetical protein
MDVFAREPATPAFEDCLFYHTMDIPGYGLVEGQWDLRGKEADYLGNVALEGKRVLEMGTASGYLCGYMEGLGASIIAYDLSPEYSWDIVPHVSLDVNEVVVDRKRHIAALNAGWWLNWKARKLTAKMVYGSVYDVSGSIGDVDMVTFGSILLHLRDPFLALWNGARLARSTVVVTDVALASRRLLRPFQRPIARTPIARFIPKPGSGSDIWWTLTPRMIQNMLGVLGFEESAVTWHRQLFSGKGRVPMFTVVGQRTAGQPDPTPVPFG